MSMEMEKKVELEALKRELHDLEAEAKDLKAKLDLVEAKKSSLLQKISGYSDEAYEKEILEQIYKQRRGLD